LSPTLPCSIVSLRGQTQASQLKQKRGWADSIPVKTTTTACPLANNDEEETLEAHVSSLAFK